MEKRKPRVTSHNEPGGNIIGGIRHLKKVFNPHNRKLTPEQVSAQREKFLKGSKK